MKKLMALILAGAMVFALAACGSSSNAPTASGSASGSASAEATASGAPAASADAEVSDVLADGKLVVGTNAAFPPFEYLGDDGTPTGFDMALIQAIGDKLGVEVEIQDMEFDALVTSIGNKIDIAIAGMTITEERKNAVDFSDPYYDAVQMVILPADSEIASLDDLSGKNLGCQIGTTGDFLIQDMMAEDSTITNAEYNKGVDAVNDLLNGRLDAVIIDKNPAQVFQGQFPDDLKLLEGDDFGFENEQYAIAMPKGDTALVNAINKALAELKADGTYDQLVAEYIEQ